MLNHLKNKQKVREMEENKKRAIKELHGYHKRKEVTDYDSNHLCHCSPMQQWHAVNHLHHNTCTGFLPPLLMPLPSPVSSPEVAVLDKKREMEKDRLEINKELHSVLPKCCRSGSSNVLVLSAVENVWAGRHSSDAISSVCPFLQRRY